MKTYLQIFKHSLIVLIALIFSVDILLAQITITRENLEQSFAEDLHSDQQISFETAMIAPLADLNGPDQTWDFSELNYEGTIEGTYRLSANQGDAPGGQDEHFALAESVLVFDIEFMDVPGEEESPAFEEIYAYLSIDDASGEALSLGEVITMEESEDEFITYARPARVDFVLPATFGDSWNYEYEEEIAGPGFSSTADINAAVEIDGWGQAITPAGNFDVLRKKITRTHVEAGMSSEDVTYHFIDVNGRHIAIIEEGETDEELQASVFSYELVTSVEPDDQIAQSYKLNQNYPNPFNPLTIISYELPENSNVTLEVFDMLGRQVALLTDGHKSAGTHEVTFNADNLPSGVYSYRLIAGDVVLTRTMTIIK